MDERHSGRTRLSDVKATSSVVGPDSEPCPWSTSGFIPCQPIKAASHPFVSPFLTVIAIMLKSKKPGQPIIIPPKDTAADASDAPKTPKTPADEGIDFFESAFKQGDAPIRVYQLQLDPDGGPNKSRSVSRCSSSNLALALNLSFSIVVHASPTAL